MNKTIFDTTRQAFRLPLGIHYLDGNSLGPLHKGVEARLGDLLNAQWGEHLIGGWNLDGWVDLPRSIGERIGRLIGAAPGSVVMGDTLSIKVYQALASALELRPDRRVILSDSNNFPTDLYMAQGLVASLDKGHVLKVVKPEEVEAAIDDSVAVVMLTEVDYRTGRLHDMAALTRKAHDMGALTIWDLAHSAGAIAVNLSGTDADFAVGCTYKFLNGGPGAPAFIYVAPRLADQARPALSGWFGHETPFAFDPDYRPAPGIERMRVGTPPVMALAALDAALDAWDGLTMDMVRARSIELSQAFIAVMDAQCPDLDLASPRDPMARGSQVSYLFENGFAVIQALIEQGVIGDYRAPGIMRFGFTPLYLGFDNVEAAAGILADTINSRRWDQDRFKIRGKVT